MLCVSGACAAAAWSRAAAARVTMAGQQLVNGYANGYLRALRAPPAQASAQRALRPRGAPAPSVAAGDRHSSRPGRRSGAGYAAAAGYDTNDRLMHRMVNGHRARRARTGSEDDHSSSSEWGKDASDVHDDDHEGDDSEDDSDDDDALDDEEDEGIEDSDGS